MKKRGVLITISLILVLVSGFFAFSSLDLIKTDLFKDILNKITGRVIAEENIIVHYEFENNADDLSGNGYDGINHGGSFVEGKEELGQALSFDGVDDYVEVPGDVFQFSEGFSYGAWFKRDPTAEGSDGILTNMDWQSGTKHRGYNIYTSDSSVYCYIGNSVDGTTFSRAAITEGEWYHIMCVYDGEKVIAYLNGVAQIPSAARAIDYDTRRDYLEIGRFYQGTAGWNFKGEIDDAQIWDVALSAEMVMRAYENYLAGIEEGELIAYYGFEDFEGPSIVNDLSGNNHQGTSYGNVEFVEGEHEFGKAISLSGDGAHVSVLSFPDSSSGSWTLGAWVNTGGVTGWTGLVEHIDSSSKRRAIDLDTTGKPYIIYGDDKYRIAILDEVDDGQWHHVLGTYDAGTGIPRLYIDGTEVSLGTEGSASHYTAASELVIGCLGSKNSRYCLDGMIDEVKFWSRALSAGEIQTEYERMSEITERKEATTYYRFENNLLDFIGNNDGVNYGGSFVDSERVEFGQALSLGEGDYVNVLNFPDSSSGSWTLGTWVKTSGVSTWTGLVEHIDSSSKRRAIDLDTTGKPYIIYGDDKYRVSASGEIDDGQWHHVLGTYDAVTGIPRLYIDGTEVSLGTEGSASHYTVASELVIGCLGSKNSRYCLDGMIDEVKFWSRALSAGEIQAEYEGQERCDDPESTPYSACSVNKPLYCEEGVLINHCSLCGCAVDYGCKEDGSCEQEAPTRNAKDLNLYSSKEVFLISNKNWNDIFAFFPVTTWKENNEILEYPLLSYNENYFPTEANDQTKPAISGNRIVWQDNVDWDNDIYSYDILTQQEEMIAIEVEEQINPEISESGNIVVWQDDRNGNYDIYMYDLETSDEKQVTAQSGDQINPSISGENVVWQDDRNGDYDIYMYGTFFYDLYLFDLPIDVEVGIAIQSGDQINPEISENVIVWQDDRRGGL